MKDKLIYPKSNKDKSKEGGLAGASRGANYYIINLKTAKLLCHNLYHSIILLILLYDYLENLI